MKRKQGRPRTVDAVERVEFKCSARVAAKIKRMAKAWKVTYSEVIRRLVEDAKL
jgi:hypothetical protein